MTRPHETLADWLKAHDELMRMERGLAELSLRFAEGNASDAEMQEARRSIEAQRALAHAVLERAMNALRQPESRPGGGAGA